MNTIDKLNQQIAENKSNIADIESKIQAEYNVIFDDSLPLKRALEDIENRVTGDYSFNEYAEVVYKVEIPAEFDKEILSYLNCYLVENHSVYIDDGYLTEADYGAIVINQDGDIYDSEIQKFFANKNDYETDIARNALIEAYMKETGCYPGVFHADYYGNISPINTSKNEDK